MSKDRFLLQAKSLSTVGYHQPENSRSNETSKDILVHLIQGSENQNSVHIPLHVCVIILQATTAERKPQEHSAQIDSLCPND